MVLEGYSNLERFSYFNVKFYPCHIQTLDGKPCYNYTTQEKFFTFNTIELKIQDNDLNPEDYKKPVIRTEKDMNSPVFKDLYQLIYSYIQIVNIETDEDITGLNFFTDTIRKEQYTKYESSFLIASPLFYYDILQTGGPICDVTLQLSAKVLTQKRQYTQLIDVLGDVGGLMEILLTALNIISSFITEILYDKSLVNDLFSFDLEKKVVIFNTKFKKDKSFDDRNITLDQIKKENNEKIENYRELAEPKNIEIYSKENLNELKKVNKFKTTRKKVKRKKKITRSVTNLKSVNEINIAMEEKVNNIENKLSLEENKNIFSIDNKTIEPAFQDIPYKLTSGNKSNKLQNVYINNWLICCFWCTPKKKNVNKVLFEEGSRILTQRLDILNMFNHFYIMELMQKNMGIELKDMDMSDICKYGVEIANANNNFKIIEG